MKNTNIVAQNKGIVRIVLGTAIILTIPLAMMQFNSEMNWDLFDFIVIGSLLLGTGFTYEFVSRKMPHSSHRFILGFVLFALLLLTWIHLAVGIIDTLPFAGS